MEINSRMSSILYLILASNGQIHTDSLLDEIGLSRRALQYDLTKINTCLADHHIPPIQVKNGNCIVQTESIPEIEQLLQTRASYLASSQERMTLEAIFIALDNNQTTLEGLRQELDVSKNTIQSDLRVLKERVTDSGLRLQFSHKDGYYFEGKELAIRNFISDELSTVKNRGVWQMIIQLLNRSVCQVLQCREWDAYRTVIAAIQRYGDAIAASFVEQFVRHTAVMILAAVIRDHMTGQPIAFDPMERRTLCYTEELEQVKDMLRQLAADQIVLPKDEEFYVAYLLLGMKRFAFEGQSNGDIMEMVDAFLRNLEINLGKPIERKQQLREKIALHMGPMYYRLKLGFHSSNALLEDIKQMYPRGFAIVEQSIEGMEGEIASLITEDEIAFLVMFVESHMAELKIDETRRDACKILIVCGAGVSTSVFVRAQLQDLVGEGYQFELSSASKLQERDLTEYNLIISTIRDTRLPSGTIYVSAILDEKDIADIIDRLCDTPLSIAHTTVNEIVEAFAGHVKSKDELKNIKQSLFEYFCKRRD